MYSTLRPIACALLSIAGIFAACAGCGKGTAYSESAEAYADSEDSASIAVWEPVENPHDTVAHSAFYDSVLTYVQQAAIVEREKREAPSLLGSRSPLSAENLSSAQSRGAALRSIDAFLNAMQNANDDLDAIYGRYYAYLKRVVDSAFRKDSSARVEVLKEIARKEVLAPRWRPKLDSLEFAIAYQTKSILRLVDTNESTVDFSNGLAFRDAQLAHAFDSLRNELQASVAEEAKVVREGRSALGESGATSPLPPDSGGRPF